MTVSRRMVLGAAVGGALGAAGLAGCRTNSSGDSGGTTQTPYTAPAYVPFEGVTPDLPGTADGVPPAFFKYPSPATKREGFPLPKIDNVTALLSGGLPTVPPENNAVYKNFWEQIGTQADATVIVAADYSPKFATTVASSDLPDIIQIDSVPNLTEMLEARFTNLSEYLEGDKIKQYPGLANIPTDTWDIGKFGGRIYGIAQPRSPAGTILSTRGDLLRARGIEKSPVVNNGEDLLALFKELSDKTHFAMGSLPSSWFLPMILESMGAPNNWGIRDGKFVHAYTTPEYVAALEVCNNFWKAGVLHPESFAQPAANITWWTGGITSLYRQGFGSWGGFQVSNPDWEVGIVAMPKWEGGGPASIWKSPAGYGGTVGITKQDSPERVEQLLRIADYLASPFGTTQYLENAYGLEGVTYKMENDIPVTTESSAGSPISGWPYMGTPANMIFVPGYEETARAMHAYCTERLPNASTNESTGLYSATDRADSAKYSADVADLQRSIILGEKPASAWTEWANKWKSEIGDKIAGEYEAEKAKG